MEVPSLAPDLGSLADGANFCTLAKVQVWDPMQVNHILVTLPKVQKFVFEGQLPFEHDRVTLLDVELVKMYPTPSVQLGAKGKVIHHIPPSWDSMHRTIEVCSGIGAMGLGALAAGFRTVVAIDFNPRMIEMLSSHSSAKTMVADVCNSSTWFDVWKMFPEPMGLLSGIACQPYSTLGDGRSAEDQRSASLPGSLAMGYFLQCPFLVLECVEPVLRDAFVQGELKRFQDISGYQVSQCVLKLQDIWPCRRTRWWCILTAPCLGSIVLDPPPPLSEVSSVGHLIPCVVPWEPAHEEALMLTPLELEAFGVNSLSHTQYLLTQDGVAPTALHSYGSQLTACHCGCRTHPFSEHRLKTKGLFGLLVSCPPGEVSAEPFVRHIHPAELQILNGVDPALPLGNQMRLILTGVGQLASPLQSCWVLAHIAAQIDQVLWGDVTFKPLFHLQALRSWLVHRAQQVWGPSSRVDECCFAGLVSVWNATESLHLDDLLHGERWTDVLDVHSGIGQVLDFLIRRNQHDIRPIADFDSAPGQLLQELHDVSTKVLPCTDSGRVQDSEFADPSFAAVVNPSLSGQVGSTSPPDATPIITGPVATEVPPELLVQDIESVPRHELCIPAQLSSFEADPEVVPLNWLQAHYGSLGNDLCTVPQSLHNTHCLLIWMRETPEPLFVPFRSPTAVVSDLIRAECTLDLAKQHAKFSDIHGVPLVANSRLIPGMIILGWLQWESWPLPRLPCVGRPDLLGLRTRWESWQLPRMPSVGRPDVLGLRTHLDDEMPAVAAVSGDVSPAFGPCRTEVNDRSHPYDEALISRTAPWTQGHPGSIDVPSSLCISMAPLLQLSGNQFLSLHLPNVANPAQLLAVQAQVVANTERIALLDQQGHVMADDEVRFHLAQFAAQANVRRQESGMPTVLVLDPLQATSWTTNPGQTCVAWCAWHRSMIHAGSVVISAVCLNGHWVPLHFRPYQGTLMFCTWDAPQACHDRIVPFYNMLSEALGFQNPVVHREHRLFFDSELCGALAIAFVASCTGPFDRPQSHDDALQVHKQLRKTHVDFLVQHTTCTKPGIWGMGANIAPADALETLLASHGVPPELAADRAATAIKVLGLEAVEHALRQKNPWQQLKTVGTQKRFQFLQPAELQKIIRGNRQKDVGPKTAKPRLPKPTGDLHLDPEKLQVLPGTFRAHTQVRAQLSTSQVGPMASGFLLVTREVAEPYLRSGRLVSDEPLALVILTHDQIDTPLATSQITVPCKCAINHEPVLVSATLVQIGRGEVTKYAAPNVIMLDTLDVVTVKLMIYRDEADDWPHICQAPIKYLQSKFPCLTLCHTDGCQCAAWHNVNKLKLSDPLVDVWRRQWLNNSFKPVKASDAKIYSVCVRVPRELLTLILGLSGTGGIFAEPRSLDGKSVSEDFTVVWSKLPWTEMNHIKQTRPKVLGLARILDRRGLRVATEDAKDLHGAIHPGTLYMPSGPRQQFITGPWPYGCSRQSIEQTLAAFKWIAKPVQPASQVEGKGHLWLVQSVESPPESVFHTDHGEIMVSLHKLASGPQHMSAPKPVAAPATLALCGTAPAPSKCDDLLQKHDPWKGWRGPAPGLPAPPVPVIQPTVTESMQQMEQRIRNQVLAALPQQPAQPQPMERDDVPDRVLALEDQMQKMIGRQSALETSVSEFSSRQGAQLSAMQTQLHGHIETQQQNVQAMFQSQMEQIRSLLAKRKDPAE